MYQFLLSHPSTVYVQESFALFYCQMGKKALRMLYHCHYCEVQAPWKILFYFSAAGSSKINLTATPRLSCHCKNSLCTDSRYFQTRILSCKRARLSGPFTDDHCGFLPARNILWNEWSNLWWLAEDEGERSTQRLLQKNEGQKVPTQPKCKMSAFWRMLLTTNMKILDLSKTRNFRHFPSALGFFSQTSEVWHNFRELRQPDSLLTQPPGAKNSGGSFINHTDVCFTSFKSNLEEILPPCQSLGNIWTGRREQKMQHSLWGENSGSWIQQNHSVSALKAGTVITAIISSDIYLLQLDSIMV